MTLSDPTVLRLLSSRFVSGWRNIDGVEPYAGKSGTHLPNFPAAKTTNCAGHHNVQMFFMEPDGSILHCLPGYWSPEAFAEEARLVLALDKVYRDEELSVAERNMEFLDLQLTHALRHDRDTVRDSELQGFDRRHVDKEGSDFRREDGLVTSCLKTTDQVVHERMAERPFVTLEDFDVAGFVDMGVKSFDSHTDGCRDPAHAHDLEEHELAKKEGAVDTPDSGKAGGEGKGKSKNERERRRPTSRPTR